VGFHHVYPLIHVFFLGILMVWRGTNHGVEDGVKVDFRGLVEKA
jgi:hypothetical protein